MFWFMAIALSCFFGLGNAASCRQMVAKAGKKPKIFASPNFPNKFAEQTQCTWLVQAPSGYRVRVNFKTFVMVESFQSQCARQGVKIVDTFTGYVDGPYCGNTPPPEVISTGDKVKIVLESNAVGMKASYKGFQVRYWQTTALPSFRYRDAAGRWRSYRVANRGFTLPPQTVPTPTRDPNEVDENNNAAIDAINNKVNRESNKNEEINKKNNNPPSHDQIGDYYDSPSNTVTVKRKKPPKVKYRPPSGYNPTFDRPTVIVNRKIGDSSKKESGPPVSPGALVAIVLASVIVVVVASILMYRAFKRSKNAKRNRSASPQAIHRTKRSANVHQTRNVNRPRAAERGAYKNCQLPESSPRHQQPLHQPYGRPGSAMNYPGPVRNPRPHRDSYQSSR